MQLNKPQRRNKTKSEARVCCFTSKLGNSSHENRRSLSWCTCLFFPHWKQKLPFNIIQCSLSFYGHLMGLPFNCPVFYYHSYKGLFVHRHGRKVINTPYRQQHDIITFTLLSRCPSLLCIISPLKIIFTDTEFFEDLHLLAVGR